MRKTANAHQAKTTSNRLSRDSSKFMHIIMDEIVEDSTNCSFTMVAGQIAAKQALQVKYTYSVIESNKLFCLMLKALRKSPYVLVALFRIDFKISWSGFKLFHDLFHYSLEVRKTQLKFYKSSKIYCFNLFIPASGYTSRGL